MFQVGGFVIAQEGYISNTGCQLPIRNVHPTISVEFSIMMGGGFWYCCYLGDLLLPNKAVSYNSSSHDITRNFSWYHRPGIPIYCDIIILLGSIRKKIPQKLHFHINKRYFLENLLRNSLSSSSEMNLVFGNKYLDTDLLIHS